MKNDDSDIHQRKIQISINKIFNFYQSHFDLCQVGSDFTMSRPGTTASGVSTFVSRDGDDEPPKVQAEQRQVINLTPEEKVHFFSLIRHNKVPEIEDLLSKVFVFGCAHLLLFRIGNTGC